MNEFTTEQKKRLIEQLSDSSTALVCNALDLLEMETPYMDESIRCMTPGLPALVGEVVTIKVDSSSIGNTPDASLYYKMLEDMSKTDIPKVVIIQTIGSDKRRECVAGDGMAKTMLSVGAQGIVTDGGIRDIKDVVNQGFRIFAMGHVVQHTKLVWSGLYEPVQMGGITIRTGDILHGDVDGIMIVPKECWGTIAKACRVNMEFEKRAHVTLRQSGFPIPKRAEMVAQYWIEAKKEMEDSEDFGV